MYELAVMRAFDATHSLVGGDWGKENHPHSHHYRVEVLLSAESVDRFGYVMDVAQMDRALDETVRYFAGKSLNDLPEFSGLNPSMEHFARIFCSFLRERVACNRLRSIRVRIWESEAAWAGYAEKL